MHEAVRDYVSRYASDARLDVLDIGGRDVNGTVRELWPRARYTVLDLRPGPNVDIVADATVWQPAGALWDLVVCTEVLEHCEAWRDIVVTAYRAAKPGGRIAVTAAGPGRAPHSAIEATALQPGEWYANIEPEQLRDALIAAGWVGVEIDRLGLDVRATAVKPMTT